MMQYSVYSRLCNSVENAEVHFHRLSKVAPNAGSIRCMVVTEKQYSAMKIIAGEQSVKDKPAKFVQISFL